MYFYQKDLKTWETTWKVLKRKFERDIVAYLVAGKISRNIVIKFEVAESKLSLLIKSNAMHVEEYNCE